MDEPRETGYSVASLLPWLRLTLSWAGLAADDAYTFCEGWSTPCARREGMPAMRDASSEVFNPSQATELALLVELEARWENLRTNRLPSPEVPPTTQDLHGKQKAYEAFRLKLAAYNKRYTPAHVPELLLNTPTRLGI